MSGSPLVVHARRKVWRPSGLRRRHSPPADEPPRAARAQGTRLSSSPEEAFLVLARHATLQQTPRATGSSLRSYRFLFLSWMRRFLRPRVMGIAPVLLPWQGDGGKVWRFRNRVLVLLRFRSSGTPQASACGGKDEQPARRRADRPPPSSDGVEGTTESGPRWKGTALKGNEAQGRHGRPPPATEVGRTGLDDGARPRSRPTGGSASCRREGTARGQRPW
jgi:hypothetical protein